VIVPELSQRTKIIVSVVIVAVSFACGRFSVQKPEVKTQITTNTKESQDQKKDTHIDQVTTTTKKPDGSVITTTETKTDIISDTKQIISQDQTIKQDIIPPKTNTLNVSLLGGIDFKSGIPTPTYGLSVNKQLVGPVTIGAFGLMNGVVGVSIGLNF